MSANYVIKGKTGGSIKIPRFDNYTNPYPIQVWYCLKDDFAPTHFDLRQYGNGVNIFGDLVYLANHEDSQENLQSYVDSVVANTTWLWGNLYNGGMGVYSYVNGNNNYYSLFLSQGFITNEETGNIRFLLDYVGNNKTDFLSWKASNIVFVADARRDNILKVVSGNYNMAGVSGCYASIGEPQYLDPLDPTAITDVSYHKSDSPIDFGGCVDASLSSLIVEPVIGNAFYLPMIGLNGDSDSFSQGEFTMTPSIPEGYTYSGTWYGGTDNLEEDPNSKGGTASTGGGGGSFDNNSDPVDFPSDDQFSVDGINSGLITIYVPTQSELIAFNRFLFSSITEAMSLVFKRLLSDPIDYIISLGLIHLTPSNLSDSEEITFCGVGTGVLAKHTTKQFQRLNCGSINIEEQFKTNLDYGGFSSVQIYLPYCGVHSLDIQEVMGGTLTLQYMIDLLSGACVAMLKITRNKRNDGDADNLNSVLYTFTGNCVSQLPITSRDFKQFFQGLATLGIGAASQNGGAIAQGVTDAGLGFFNPDVKKAGTIQTDYGFMTAQKPYLILQRPIQQLPSSYMDEKGYPSNITVKLGACRGFTKIYPETLYANKIDGITEEEVEMLKDICSKGIYIEY